MGGLSTAPEIDLHDSLVLLDLLSRRGIASTVVLGVEVGSSFSAHAWVESGGRALLEPLDETARLVSL